MATFISFSSCDKEVDVCACCGDLRMNPLSRSVLLVRNSVYYYRVYRVFLRYHFDGSYDFTDALPCSRLPEQVLHVRRLALVLPALRVEIAFTILCFFLSSKQLLLLLIHQLVLVKEADELSLSRFEHDLTGKLMHPKPLDDVEDVNLQVELLLRVLLHPVFALHFRSTAEAALAAKVAQSKAATVLVGEELPVDDCLIEAPLQASLEVFDGFSQILIRTHLLIVEQLV